MKHFVFDIETIPLKIEKNENTPNKTIPSPINNQIICAAGISFDQYEPTRIGLIGGEIELPSKHQEVKVLNAFGNVMAYKPRIVTFNGRRFDVPVLLNRSFAQLVSVHPLSTQDYTNRFKEHHIDIADILACYGASKMNNLNDVAENIGLPGKEKCDGKSVHHLYLTNQYNTIEQYCLEDTTKTALAFLRLEWMRSRITSDQYEDSVAGLLNLLTDDGRTDIVKNINYTNLIM